MEQTVSLKSGFARPEANARNGLNANLSQSEASEIQESSPKKWANIII